MKDKWMNKPNGDGDYWVLTLFDVEHVIVMGDKVHCLRFIKPVDVDYFSGPWLKFTKPTPPEYIMNKKIDKFIKSMKKCRKK